MYDALKELNIRIPGQMAVMGFRGYPGSGFLSPPLSTVDVMYENIGRMAAELMLNSDSWFGGKRPVTVITPHRVVARESTRLSDTLQAFGWGERPVQRLSRRHEEAGGGDSSPV